MKRVACSRSSLILAIGLLSGWLWSCKPQTAPNSGATEDAKPRVVSTSSIIADLTEKIGGDEIEHKGILQPGADPHTYEPVPQDNIALERAELILYNGYNLEPGLIKLIEAAGINAKKLAVAEVIKPLQQDYEGNRVPDPHVWGDANNAIQMVNAIRDRLIELSPEDKAEFEENAAKLTEELKRLDDWIARQIQTIPEARRKLVTTHDAFEYYARAYGLDIIGTLIGISTEEQPSARTVRTLSDAIKKSKIPAIFAETTINPTLIKAVAKEVGVNLYPRELYSDSLGAPGSEGDTYSKMLQSNTRAIVEGLGGNYRPFEASQTKSSSNRIFIAARSEVPKLKPQKLHLDW